MLGPIVGPQLGNSDGDILPDDSEGDTLRDKVGVAVGFDVVSSVRPALGN